MSSMKAGPARATLRALLPVSLAAALASCGRSPVPLGLVGVLSGRQSELAIAGRNGVELRIEEANAKGGLRGRRVELLVEDDEGTEAGFREAAARIAARKARIVIGPFLSSEGEFAAASAEPLLFLSPTVSAARFSGRDDKLLRIMASNAAAAKAIGGFLGGKAAGKGALVVRDETNAAYADDYGKLFAGAFEAAGGGAVRSLSVPGFGEASYLDTARKIAEAAPEALLVIAGGPDAAMLFRQLNRLGFRGLRAVSGWTMTSDFLAQGVEAAEGVYFSHQYDLGDSSPRYAAFKSAYLARFGREPSFSAVYGYEAADLALDLLAAKPGAGSEELKAAALAWGPRRGLQDEWSFDRYGDASRPARVFRLAAGRAERQ
ncbi:MAG TPA: ABC transporter substrate-binding protein [Spirochaetia bacterium]|nr:ABC transporter substrate-binding protein [Spirochaetia bacterium]